MSRVTKEHDIRRTEILDMAQRFFYKKGYENTSIRNIIDIIGIAKGTFYHYFDSKQSLLDELVQRTIEQMIQVMTPIVAAPNLNATEKLNQLFAQTGRWKATQKDVMIAMLRTLYMDENLPLRHRLEREAMPAIVPLLTTIIQQGVEEGRFQTDYPEDVGELLFRLNHALADTFADLLLAHIQNKEEPTLNPLPIMERKVNAHHNTVARLLGTSESSLQLFDMENIRQWFE